MHGFDKQSTMLSDKSIQQARPFQRTMSDELKAKRKLENWDRHTSVNTKAMGLWFMTSSS